MKVKLTALVVIILIVFGITGIKRVNRLNKGNYINIYNAKADLVKKDYNDNNVKDLSNLINQKINSHLDSNLELPKGSKKQFKYRITQVNDGAHMSITTYKNKYAEIKYRNTHEYLSFYIKLTNEEYQKVQSIH
ncbi:hypothetical protein [Apilactobacillus xinyiensis]|uniref:DUF1310 family protein n=1 Tax=Apilactobacillus xinyiensis TaxID=2841032 RepID=A0ABT0I2D9_9LACO|nr:hypothetical protein [Apilactobacillus xinyiensis]MCK8624883.1 hypothetical protein [Apilactobacillus xinyiensis]